MHSRIRVRRAVQMARFKGGLRARIQQHSALKTSEFFRGNEG